LADRANHRILLGCGLLCAAALLCAKTVGPSAAEGPATFLLVCPQSDLDSEEHPEAERRLRAALTTLRDEGIEAHGQIAHPDPYTAAMHAVQDERVDEIIISTLPGQKSGWLRKDVVERIKDATGLPVVHVTADREPVTA